MDKDSVSVEKTGYEKFKEVGERLKQRNQVDYQAMSLGRLKALKIRAASWLETHTSHPKFPEALRRYEHIEDEILQKTAAEVML